MFGEIETRQQDKRQNSFWASCGFAWIVTSGVELMIVLIARKDPIFWVACIQYALLLLPPMILAHAIRAKSYGQVLSHQLTVFTAVTVLDLLHSR